MGLLNFTLTEEIEAAAVTTASLSGLVGLSAYRTSGIGAVPSAMLTSGIAIGAVAGIVVFGLEYKKCADKIHNNSPIFVIPCMLATDLWNAGKEVINMSGNLGEEAVFAIDNELNKLTKGKSDSVLSYIGEDSKEVAKNKGVKFYTNTVRRGAEAAAIGGALPGAALVPGAIVAAPLAPLVVIGAGFNAIFNKKTRAKLKACGKLKGWQRFKCGTKTFFGFQ